VVPRVSVDVSYFRRSYGNFNVTDNRAVSASDYDRFSIVAPVDSRLPDGGGYTISGFNNLNPAAQTRLGDNFATLAKNFGEQTEVWNGVDIGANARLSNGVFVQGGTSTGRTVSDNCEIVAVLPEVSPNGAPYCHEVQSWLTQVKGLASYTIPRIDVSIAGTYQYLPGPAISANWVVATSSSAVQGLGRPLTGGNQTINLLEPSTEYGKGLNQLDLRFAKNLRFGTTRTMVSLDIYNATNANTVLTHNNTFSPTATTWQQPTLILQPRFFKIGVQFDW
jgi:hypothetical protein